METELTSDDAWSGPQDFGAATVEEPITDALEGLGCYRRRTERTAAELAPLVGLSTEEVEAAYTEIERRRVATRYLHAPAVLVEPAG